MAARKPLGEALNTLAEVWTNPGPHPEYHEKVIREILDMFPLLVRAVDDVVEAHTKGSLR